jgi:predicted PurR-regulated permease PerM
MALDIAVIFGVLWFAGLRDYALTLAITAGLLYTIPYFGALVSTVLIGLVALATHGLTLALIVVLIMIFIHQVVFDNILAPRIIGGSVNLHPLLTLIALMSGGTLFGVGGTLLAVPIAAAFQVILIRLFPQFKTDVVAVRRAANVVQKTIAKDTETTAPAARKDADAPALQREQDAARADAKEAQVLP